MGKKVKIRTLVALAGPTMSLASGDEWEVDEEVAEARIRLGLAEPIEPPATRRTVNPAGQHAQTAAVTGGEMRSHSDQEAAAVQGWLAAVDGLTEAQARSLVAAGYPDLAAAQASDNDLTDVTGVGKATAERIRHA